MPARKGDEHPQTRLSDADVAEVRRLYANGKWTLRQLAGTFAVDKSTVHRAVRGVRKTARPSCVDACEGTAA